MDNALDSSVEPTNDYRFNPIMSLKNEYRKNYTNNLQLNGFVEYEFIKGLKLKVSGGYTYDAVAMIRLITQRPVMVARSQRIR